MPLTALDEPAQQTGGRLTPLDDVSRETLAPGQREGHGVWDSLVSGVQGSASGMLVRGALPEVVLTKDHSKWYERALGGAAGLAADMPWMIEGGMAGTAAGGAAAGPVGAVLGGGAGMMAVPALIRESLVHAYQTGQADSSTDFLSRVGIVFKGLTEPEVLKATGKAALVGAATLGAGRVAAPLGLAGVTAAEVGTMTVASAALEGHLPDMQDFADAAIVVGGMKVAGRVASKLATVYEKTGRPPDQVAADAAADPKIAAELKADGDGIPSAYKPLAEAENAREAVPGSKAQQVVDQPFADLPQRLGRDANGKLDPAVAGHINYNIESKRVNSSEDAMAVASRLSEVYKEEGEIQRDGPKGWAEQREATQTFLANLADNPKAAWEFLARTPGTAAGWREMRARAELASKAAVDMAVAAREYEAKAGNVTPEETATYLATIERAAMIQATFLGARSEPGRAMQALQDTKFSAERAKHIQEVLGTYGKDPMMLAKMLKDIDNPESALKFASKVTKATKWEMVIEAYKAGLIGPISQMANVIGNVSFAATHDIVEIAAAFKPGGDVKMVQPAARIIAQFQAAYDGLKIAADFIGDNWTRPMQALRKLDEKPATKQEQHRKAIPGDVGVLVRSLSFPWLSMMDGAFRMIAERGEINSWAAGEAAKEFPNIFSREFRERMAGLAQNVPEKQMEKITEFGTRAVFQDKLGPGMRSLQTAINSSKVGPLFIPYIQTPTNMFRELARSFPLSAPFVDAWRADIKAGGAARDRAMAEIVVGGAVFGVVAALAFDGERITGYGPPEPEKRRGWLETHQSYSVKFNGTYYDFSRIQPIGTLIGLAADMSTIWKHMTPDEQDRIPKMISIAFSQAVTNQTWLKGMVDLARGVAESDRYGPKIAQNLAAGLMPASGWLGQTAQLMDPYIREINSIMDAIRNKIPLAREGLTPSISGLTGDPIKNPERLGVVLPIKAKPAVNDKVLNEAARLGVGVAKAPKTIEMAAFGDHKLGEVKLTPEQQQLFSTTSGKLAHSIMEQIVNSPRWDSMAPVMQKRIFADVIKEARSTGAAAALPAQQRAEKARMIANALREKMKASVQ